MARGKPIDDLRLAKQLRPFAVRPQTFRIGQALGRGYLEEDFLDPARRYASKPDWEAFLETVRSVTEPAVTEAPKS